MVRSPIRTYCNLILILLLSWGILLTFSNLPAAALTIYEQRQNHSPDGIGKYYMGREIAQVMGYTGAGWLERSSREGEEKPSQIVQLLNLEPDNIVADIGAGTGYLSFLIAPLLPQGKVLAVDIQPQKIHNVEPILGTQTNPNLPEESIDLAIFVDAYHELAYPQEVMTEIVKALKPGGRVVLVEYRGENPLIMIKKLHKMTQKQVKKEMQSVGLVYQETKNSLPQQHFMVFAKG
jgi:SAM-dependent methyltransferase